MRVQVEVVEEGVAEEVGVVAEGEHQEDEEVIILLLLFM